MAQFSFEQSAAWAKQAGFSTSGDPSPAGVIVAIAAAEHGLQVGADWYAAAYAQTLGGHVFSPFASYQNGSYKTFIHEADQVAKTGSGATGSGIGIGDVIGAGGDTIGGAVSDTAQLAGAIGGLAGALSPLANLSSLADIAGLLVKAGTWVADRHNWSRILQIVLGAAGLYVGITIIRTDVGDLESGAALAALAA